MLSKIPPQLQATEVSPIVQYNTVEGLKKTLTVIRGVQSLLSDPFNWHQGGFAAYKTRMPDNTVLVEDLCDFNKGASPSWKSPKANCFCLLGAGSRVVHNSNYALRNAFWSDPIQAHLQQAHSMHKSVADFNDSPSTEHHHVLELLTLAEKYVIQAIDVRAELDSRSIQQGNTHVC